MKTPLSFLLVCSLIPSAAGLAQDRPALTVKMEPMILRYAMATTSQPRPVEASKAATTRQHSQSLQAIFEYKGSETLISSPSASSQRNALPFGLASAAFDSCNRFNSLATPLLSRLERCEREKFSMNNLLEGWVYDFRKRNELRLEIGSPEMNDDEWKVLDTRYEQPFSVMLFLRIKL
jgi:hypothetical protein